MHKDIVLSLGGSLIFPDKIDTEYLSSFKQLIEKFLTTGYRFAIVTGGGKICREYYAGLEAVNKSASFYDKSILGVAVTRANAHLVRAIFGDLSPSDIIYDPEERGGFEKKLVFGAGCKPGTSTDYDAVVIGQKLGVKLVVNCSNIAFVYDKDPKKFADAKAIKKMTWPDFRKQFGDTWIPGMHTPFDPRAAALAEKSGISVIITDGHDLENLANIIEGKAFVGTFISPAKMKKSVL